MVFSRLATIILNTFKFKVNSLRFEKWALLTWKRTAEFIAFYHYRSIIQWTKSYKQREKASFSIFSMLNFNKRRFKLHSS